MLCVHVIDFDTGEVAVSLGGSKDRLRFQRVEMDASAVLISDHHHGSAAGLAGQYPELLDVDGCLSGLNDELSAEPERVVLDGGGRGIATR